MLKRLFKIILWVLLIALLVTAAAVALNWTMVRNMANMKNMRTANVSEWETVRVAVPGRLDDTGLSASSTRQLSATSREQILDYHLQSKGLSLAVWIGDGIALEHYTEGLTETSHTASYSMNKSITGLVAATLDADGVLPLDTPAANYLPEWNNDPRGDITLRQLLHHTTPIAFKSMSSPDFKTMEILVGDDIEKAALAHTLSDEPVVFDYATINYQVAGAIIRRAIKQELQLSYAEYLSERIWQPVGAGDAWISSGKPGGIPRFYAGMQASLRDWLKIGLLIMNQGQANNTRVIPAKAVETLQTPAHNNPNYGLGVWLGDPDDGKRAYGPSTKIKVTHSAAYLAKDVIFFDGFGGQRVYIVPSRKVVLVRSGEPDFSYDDSILLNLVLGDIARY